MLVVKIVFCVIKVSA